MKYIEGGVTAPKGFTAAGIYCGIRKNKSKLDLAVIYSEKRCAAAAVYTQNLVKGAPIIVTKENLEDGYAQAVICNSGNANTCNADGYGKAKIMAAATAEMLGISEKDVIVGSTGVIGQPIDVDVIVKGINDMKGKLTTAGGADAAVAIMTTDTVEKAVALEFELHGVPCRIGGIAKGSGMIAPNMATMLCFITSDVNIIPEALKASVDEVTKKTFNRVTVDGDTSTNDTLSVMANGMAGNKLIEAGTPDHAVFTQALYEAGVQFAKKIAGDGEGATRLLECRVKNFKTEEGAGKIAKSVIGSSLVKAAFFGADANWGRILCAIGYAGVPADVEKIDVTLSSQVGEILVCKNGASVDFDEDNAKKILLEKEIFIDIDMNDGGESGIAWGCDLTYDYVKINGDYRT